MKKNVIFVSECVVLAALAIVMMWLLCRIFTPKFYYDAGYPTSATYSNFYELDEDSVDMIFLGSSHAVTAFDPVEIYEKYNVTSYNLACGQQDALVSFYWLEEALEYQKPSVVFLDTYYLFTHAESGYFNCKESVLRNAFGYMRPGRVKLEAVEDICNNDETQSRLSYFLPTVRFHTRWKELEENDFNILEEKRHPDLMGYAPMSAHSGFDYTPIPDDTSVELDGDDRFHYYSSQYVDRMVELCAENGIKLVLVKTPTSQCGAIEHTAAAEYADEHGLEFVDFNTESVYDALGFDFGMDMSSAGHSNIWGSDKVSDYIAEWALDRGYASERPGMEAWISREDYLEQIREDCDLDDIEDLDTYLDAIDRDRYSVLILMEQYHANDNTAKVLEHFGIEDMPEHSEGFYLVYDEGNTDYGRNIDVIDHRGSLRGGKTLFEIFSDTGNGAISVDGKIYFEDEEGIFILVYSNDRKQVIDSRAWE